MKTFEEFNINDDTPGDRYFYAVDAIKCILDEKFKELGLTVNDYTLGHEILNGGELGSRRDYMKDDEYTSVIMSFKLFTETTNVLKKFNTLTEFGNFIIKIDEIIDQNFKVTKKVMKKERFCFLVEIDSKLKNFIKSKKGENKFNL